MDFLDIITGSMFHSLYCAIFHIGGVILGHVGIRKASEMNGLNKGMAIAGLIMNYLSIVMFGLAAAGFGLIGSFAF